MTIGQKVDCVFCLASETMEARIDKKSRPYFVCACCGSRVFIHGHGMEGPKRLWGPLTLALRDGNLEAAKQLVQEEVARADRTAPTIADPA